MALKKFVLVAGQDVFMTIAFDESHKNAELFTAGLTSNPVAVDATDFPDVVAGWRWDGTQFLPPEGV